MKRREAIPPSSVPDWWWRCRIRDWDDDGDPVRAFLRWLDARSDFADRHGVTVADLPQPPTWTPIP